MSKVGISSMGLAHGNLSSNGYYIVSLVDFAVYEILYIIICAKWSY